MFISSTAISSNGSDTGSVASRGSFYTNLFCCTEMRLMFISSTAISSNGSDTGSVASRGRSQFTRFVNELEFELS